MAVRNRRAPSAATEAVVRRKRRRYVWYCYGCGASGRYNPKTGAGIRHEAHCKLAEKRRRI